MNGNYGLVTTLQLIKEPAASIESLMMDWPEQCLFPKLFQLKNILGRDSENV